MPRMMVETVVRALEDMGLGVLLGVISLKSELDHCSIWDSRLAKVAIIATFQRRPRVHIYAINFLCILLDFVVVFVH